jgi:hypothetical protein
MPKIVLSDAAPKDVERLTFSLPGAEPFEAPYESDSPVVLANAESHPWLEVERDEDAVVDPPSYSASVDPTKDPLSLQYEGDRNVAPAEPEEDVTPLAVESGLDQNVAETVGEGDNETAVTLAADDSENSPAPKTRRKSSSAAKEN